MRAVLLGLFLIAAEPAFADVADDYAACLIGQAAVALQAQPEKKDAQAAMEIAYDKCPEPKNLPADVEIDGLLDGVIYTVEKIAGK